MARLKTTRNRKRRAQTLLEAIAGLAVILPLGLMAIDLVTVVSATQANEQWAELAARAASSQGSEASAKLAATTALKRCKLSNIIKDVDVQDIDYDLGRGQVKISTVMHVAMPIPLPFLGEIESHASAIQPIVATPAPI